MITASTAARPIGRDEELRVLSSAAQRAMSGAGGVVLLEGEAGIGKSHLVDYFLDSLPSEVIVGIGRAEELEWDRPFASLRQALGPLDEAGEFGRLMEPAQPDSPLAVDHTPETQWVLVDAALSVVEGAAARGPVVVVIDDLHWADPGTTRALHRIAKVAPSLRLLIVLTMRPVPRPDEVRSLLNDLSGAEVLHLAPLDSVSTAAVASQILGAIPGAILRTQLADAGGNPFFIHELIAALNQEGAIAVSKGRAEVAARFLPPSLTLTIFRRLSFLSHDALEMLRVASVLGTAFALDELVAVLGRSATDLLAVLRETMDAEVLIERGERLIFRHDLVRSAVYEDLPVAARSSLHLQAARALAAAGAPAEVVAAQYALGARPGDSEAIQWLHRAARAAAPRSPATAVELFERALAIAAPDAPERDALEADLVVALVWAGKAVEGEGRAREILHHGVGEEQERLVRLALAHALLIQGRVHDSVEQISEAAALSDVSAAERARLLGDAAIGRLFCGDFGGARRDAENALRAGHDLGDGAAVCSAACVLSWASNIAGDIGAAVDYGESAVRALRNAREGTARQQPEFFLGIVMLDADRLDEARRLLEAGRRRGEENGTVWDVPIYHWAFALQAFYRGAWDDAVAEVEAGLEVGEEVGTRLGVVWAYAVLALVAVHRDDLGAAEEALAAAEKEIEVTGPQFGVDWMMWARSLWHEARGEHAGALAVLGGAWDLDLAMGVRSEARMLGADLVRLARRAGDEERAAAAVTVMEDAVERNPGIATVRGAALRARGLATDDVAALQAAVAAYRRGPRPFELGLACEDAARLLVETGRAGEAVPLFEEALRLFERLGAPRASARAEAGLRAAGVRRGTRGRRRRAATGWESLTPTEVDVVALVAQGCTNPEIGRRKFISRRTVETHVSHIFTKLGVSSRTELAAVAAASGRLPAAR